MRSAMSIPDNRGYTVDLLDVHGPEMAIAVHGGGVENSSGTNQSMVFLNKEKVKLVRDWLDGWLDGETLAGSPDNNLSFLLSDMVELGIPVVHVHEVAKLIRRHGGKPDTD